VEASGAWRQAWRQKRPTIEAKETYYRGKWSVEASGDCGRPNAFRPPHTPTPALCTALRARALSQVPIVGVVENMGYVECPCGTRLHPFGRPSAELLSAQYGTPPGLSLCLCLSFSPTSPFVSICLDLSI
jgi:hypothetical protein